MDIKEFETILKVGEHIAVEFKAAKGGPKDDMYETVCSFLNRFGGDIFLGVADNGEVVGIPDGAVESTIKNVIKVTNNRELLNPTFYVYPEAFKYKGRNVVRIHVPQSSDVHRYKGVCYDRVFESDVTVQSTDQIAEMYIRKRDVFTERKLFPGIKTKHLRMDLLPTIRNLIYSKFGTHPWLKLNDAQLLRESGLYEEDFTTGQSAFNAAAVLLLGRDDVIFSCFPSYKTDAILRRVNVSRYDDRETVMCNLVEAYDRLMAFGAKHLSDKFYLEDAVRVSLRDKILREAIGNSLVHREYSSSRPARFIIESDGIVADNASKALKCGAITLENLSPVSKNPIIARFFKQMGRADELGSGTRNLYHYTRLYSNADPVLEEGDTFTTTIPLNDAYSADGDGTNNVDNTSGKINGEIKTAKTENLPESLPESLPENLPDGLTDTAKKIYFLLCGDGRITYDKLASAVGVTRETVRVSIAALVKADLVRRIGPDKGGHWEVVEL